MGGITNLGGTTVTNAGFFLNTNSTATNGVKYSAPGDSFLVGPFSNTITGLTPGTSYYYRAFAANSSGTGYGASEYSFTTPSPFTYTNNGTNRTITGYTGGSVVVVPATIGGGAVTAIGNNAFQGKTNLTTVFIPNGVTTIGSYAFAACSMTAITLPNSLRSIEDHAFENNGNLTAVTIPEGVTTIGGFAFAGCRNMTVITLPNSLTSIGGYAFQSCDNLNNVIIPGSVTSLGENAFQECISLTSITLPNGLSKIESSTFWLCENLTTITIPSGVNEIESNAFLNCYKLASVYFLGNTRPTIGSDAFKNIVSVAKGYYPATASAPWSGITGLSLEPKVYNQLINGSFEGGSVKPARDYFLLTHQDNVPGWKTTASDRLIELWYSGFLGSSGNDEKTLAELNANGLGSLYQDVTMTVNSPVSYSFLHRGRAGNDEMVFKIDELSGGPGTSVAKIKFTLPVTTGTSWVRYSGSQATTVEAGKTYRFSYTSVYPTDGTGNLLDDASFGIDQDGDGLLDYEEITLGTDPLDFDSDNDGLNDGEEVVTYGTNPLLADTDGDGAPDGDEVTARTNPKDSASSPIQPVAYNDAFTAKLVVGMTTKVTTASLISNDKYSSIPEDDRGVTFVSAQPTSSGGASIRIKGGWLIYQPGSLATIGTDTFTYTVSNGARDAAGALKTATGTVTVSLVSPDMTVKVELVSPATPANAYKATFLVMPGLVFEAYGSDTPDGIYTKIGSTWTSASSGKLEVTDTAAAGKSSRFYKLKWVP
jgi:hypothetical protein